MATKEASTIDDGIVEPGIEPGASAETMLVTTDSFEEYEQEMSSSIDDRHMKESTTSTISEIQEDVQDIPATSTKTSPRDLQKTAPVYDSEIVCFITSSSKNTLDIFNLDNNCIKLKWRRLFTKLLTGGN